jgi:hypothetical protein
MARDTEKNTTSLKCLLLYYMLFSYQTGYIMWHSRLMIYIPWGASEGNIEHKPGMSHYIPCLKENKNKQTKRKQTKKKLKKIKKKFIRQFGSVFNKKMVKSVIVLLFSYQTGYIMWHSRLMLYILFGCASGNIDHKPGMSHYIPCLIAE